MGEVEEEIAVDVWRGEDYLVETHLSASHGIGGDALQRAQQAAIAHAVGDQMQLRGAAVLRELDQEIGDRALARLDAGLVGGIGDRIAARGPREERRRAGNLEVVADLRRADRRVREADVVAVQENERLRLVAIVARLLDDRVDFVVERGLRALRDLFHPQPVVAAPEPGPEA